MEQCAVSSGSSEPSRKPASVRRSAWAHSRDPWQAPPSDDQANGGHPPSPLTPGRTSPGSEPGPIPNKIAKWLTDCRTPLGASLDEQASSPSKGPSRNGCSFEDDLSLGAEANHLQRSTTKPESPGMQAVEKRSQFRQKGRSMNSTGSGKSSGTVSSVSELLDLYEEDPEEILYNLGFGREEPDIASKIPSRFFNCSSGAKGIDIKVYLGAQMQRMELENPNFALTSRFRQTEVLATVANVLSEIYSQVSGNSLQKMASQDGDMKKNSSALNAVKILKRNITRTNILGAVEGTVAQHPAASESFKADSRSQPPIPDPEPKPQTKVFKRKDSFHKDSLLATVVEEASQVITGGSQPDEGSRRDSEEKPPLPNGEQLSPALGNGEGLNALVEPAVEACPDTCLLPVLVSVSEVPELDDTERSATPPSPPSPPGSTVSPPPSNRDVCSLKPIQHCQPRDSFEMEELQSTEDEVLGTGSLSQVARDHLLRTASQQSDSSGFAEEPSSDAAANYLKVQESTDSCDSETTLTSHAGGLTSPLVLDHPAYARLQGEETLTQPSTDRFTLDGVQEEVPPHVDQVVPASVSGDACGFPADLVDLADDLGSVTETNLSSPSSSSTALGPVGESDPHLARGVSPERSSDPGVEPDGEKALSTSERLRGALLRAEQRVSLGGEERMGRVWVRTRDLLRDAGGPDRYPLQRSSSLPTSWISPARVVSSVHIRLGQGVVKHHLPTYSYRYEEKEEEGTQGDEDESQARCRSTLLISPAPADGNAPPPPPGTQNDGAAAPPYPLNVPQHLIRSASSLYSAPADCPGRGLAEAPWWCTSSVPDLSQHTTRPHPLFPRHAPHRSAHEYGEAASSANHRAVNTPPYIPPSDTLSSPYTHTLGGSTQSLNRYSPSMNPPFTHPPHTRLLHTHPQNATFSEPHSAYTHPLCAPYSRVPPPHSVPHSTPYGFNMQGTSYQPHIPLTHSHTAPYSLPYGSTPYHPTMTYGHHYNASSVPLAPFAPPSSMFPCESPSPAPAVGSTEMQLRRVLHEIRDTVQSINQTPSMPRGGSCSDLRSPRTSLYEELQMRRQSLNMFRTQMMDLELTLMRQQAMVYQHLSPEDRREAEQLQRLRVSVRQELQELELQLEDRLLSLEDQLRSTQHSRLCRHPLSVSRGLSIDSLNSSSALKAMEPVCDLLREQLSLQSELGYDASLSAAGTPVSGRSSRATSPVRAAQPSTCCSPSLQRGGLYRSSVSLVPAVPSRPGAGAQQPAPAASRGQSPCGDMPQGEEPDPQERDGGGGGGGNNHFQQLIAEIKQNLAEEIRQEIMNELLAAVSLRRPPVAAREPPS